MALIDLKKRKVRTKIPTKLGRKDITKLLTKAAIGYWVKKRYACLSELGVMPWGKRRADVVAVNHRGEIIILEIKSGLADFQTDFKLQHYLEFANRTYLVMYHKHWDKVVKKGLSVPKGMGVLVLTPDGHCTVLRKAKFKQLDPAVQLNIFIRMAWASAPFSRRQGTRRVRVYLE